MWSLVPLRPAICLQVSRDGTVHMQYICASVGSEALDSYMT